MRCIVSGMLIGLLLPTLSVAQTPLERWVYAPANFLVPAEVERMERLITDAARLGYSHLLITDSKFCRLDEMPERYFQHIARLRNHANAMKIELTPAVFPVGYSNDLLSQNVNLAEGLPVRDALFVVRNGQAQIVADPPVSLPSFTERREWNFIDEPFAADGDAITVSDPRGENCRAMKVVDVSPYRHYRVSVMVRTQDFDGQPQINVLEPETGRRLSHTNLKVTATQDWSLQQITFNSLGNKSVNVYLGAWGPTNGTLSLKNAAIEECGLLNVLRRDGTPLVVIADELAPAPMTEGRDFETVSDEQLGTVPYAGEYEVWHQSPPIRMKDSWKDGTRLRVSWFHPHIVYDGQVCGCVTEPQFVDLLRQQADGVEKLFPGTDRMMSHDEWRVFGWDQSFAKLKLTPGQVASDNARTCVSHLKQLDPDRRIAVWSDMFDPHHNAVKDYYLVNGDLTGAWEGLDKSVMIMNWNFGKRSESLKFFADRGHEQIIAGFYDDSPEQITTWLDTVRGDDIDGVLGVMYTTWRQDYSQLEAFRNVVDRWEAK